MKRLVVALIWIMFLFLVVGGCSTKDQCSADTDCKTGYACGDDKKCHEIEVVLLFQDIADGQTLTIADDVDESDGIIQIDITVAAQTPGTATPLKDGTPVTLEVKSSAAAAPDDDAVNGAPAAVTKSYAGILVNGFARFLRIPFEEGSHVVTAYLTLSPAEKVIANLTATYQQAETLVMRYYKGGTVPTMLEGATLDDNDDLDAGTALFQVKMEAVTTGYPDGQEVELFIDEFSETAIGVAEIQDGVAAFPSVTVPIWENIVLRVKSGAFEDTLAFSVVSAQSCGFALNIKNDDRFGMADDTSAPLNGLQKALIISDVTLCSTGSTIEIYVDGVPGTDEPDETLSLGGATVEQIITLPESGTETDTHTVTVVMKDDDSSATGQMTVTGLFIDITAPKITVTAPVENATLTPVDDINANLEGIQIAVTGTASDMQAETVAVEVRDGTTLLGETTTGTGTYSIDEISFTATNESLTLAATARDAVGNETVVEVPLKVYVNDPAIAFQTICARTPAVNMQLNAADDADQLAGGVQCAVIVRTTDIEAATTEVSLTVNGDDAIVETIGTGGLTLFDMVTLPDGEDTLEASVMHLGVLRTAAITVQVDATLPVVTLDQTPTVDGGFAQSVDADFAFSCSEANCEYRFRIDSGAWSTYATTATAAYTALAEGLHVFEVMARDPFGNEGDATVFNWTIDTAAPVAPTVTGTTPTNDTTPEWSWNTPADTVEFRYSYDEAAWTATAGTSFTPTTTLGEGAHTLYVQGRDAAGNWSVSGSFTITIDTTAPAIPVVTGVTPTNDTTPEWSWGAVTDAVEYRYSYTDGSGWTTTNDLAFTPATALAAGDHTLFVQARDAAGNWSDSGWFTITIDLTAPDAPTVLATTPTNDTTPNWTWIPVGDAVNYRYSYDELNWTETTGTTFTPGSALTAGNHTLYVQAQDAAGNWSVSGSKEVVIDLSAPDAPVVTGTTPTNDTTPEWSWGAVTDAVEYRYSFTDGTGWTTTTGLSFTPTALAEGFHNLFVQARNDLGTWSGSGYFTIEIDTTAPAAPTVTGITPTNNAQPTWSWNTPAGAVEFRYSYDESSWTVTTTNSFTPGSALIDDAYTLYVQGRDTAGNWSTSGSFEIVIDTEEPTISIGAPSATVAKNGTSVTYTITYTGADNVTLAVGNITLNTTGGANGTVGVSGSGTATRTVTISNLTGDGTLGIGIAAGTASDTAGNTAPTAGPSATFTVDNTAPTVTITAPAADASVNGDEALTFTVSDGTVEAKIGGGSWTAVVSGALLNTLNGWASAGQGDFTVEVRSTDTAGNIGTATRTLSKDTVAPTLVIGAPSATVAKNGTDVTYTVTYTGADTVTLATGNITLNTTGTATGSVAVSGTGTTTRTVTISNLTGNGTLGIGIATGTASDTAGNTALAAGPSTTFTVDNAAPTLVIGAPSATLVKNGTSVTYTITYTGADTVTLATGDITLNTTGDASGTVGVSGSGTATRTVTISNVTGDGTLGISIAAGTASDTAGNTALAAGPSATFTVDNTAPTLVIGAPSATVAKNGDSILYTVTYTGATAVTLAPGDITLNTTGDASGTVGVSGSGTATRTVTISNLTGNGTLGISIAAGTASDTAGNTALAAGPSTTFDVDNTPPTVVINPVNACTRRTTGAITFTVTGATTTTCRFDKPDATFVEGACGSSYNYTLDGGDGTYTLTVTATDAAANSGSANTSFSLNTTTPTFSWFLPPSGTSYKAGSAVPSFVYRTKNLEAGETVEIIDADTGLAVASGTTAGSLCNATEDVSIPLDLPDKCGTYKLYAKVSDGVAGIDRYTDNLTALPATQRTYTFDRNKPVITSFVITNDADGNNVLIATEDLDATPANGMQATIVITVQDTIDIGRTVTLRNKTTGNTYTATVAGDRTATFTSITIPEGTNSFGATVVDCGGNTSDESAKTIIVDTTPPSVLFQGPTGATPGHPLWLTSRDGIVNISDELTGQQLKFKITGDWDSATPVVKHTVYDYDDPAAEVSTHTYTAGEITIVDTTVTIDLPPLAYNQHEFEITVSDARGNTRVASRTYELDPKTPNAVIAYPTDGLLLDSGKDEDAGESGVQFTMHLDLTKLETPTLTASTIDILAIPITALGGGEDTARNRKSWNGFTATLDGADQIFPAVAPLLRLGDGFWRLTVKVTDDHLNVYDTATLALSEQIDVEIETDVACSTLHLTANDKVINGIQSAPTWLNSDDGTDGKYDLYVETDSPNGTNNACISVNGGADICANVSSGRADFIAVALNTGGVENTVTLKVNNGVTIATDTYYVRADITDPTLDPAADVNPVPYVHAGIWEIGYGWSDDIDHDTATTLELDGASVRRLIFTIEGIEDIAGYPNHGTVVLTAVDPVDAIGGNTTVNIEKVGADMVAEFDELTFEDSVIGGQTDIEMLVAITEQPSGNTYTKTIFVHVNLEKPEGITPTVTTDPARGEAFVEWSAIIGNNSAYGGAFQNRVYEYQVKYEAYGGACSLDDSESVFDTGVAVIPLTDFSVADPSLNGDDFVTPKAAGEAQNYLFYLKKRQNAALTQTADIHRNGDPYCFAVRASDGVYAQDGTILATNTAPVLSTNVVDKGALQLTANELIGTSTGSHNINLKNLGDINADGRTDFVISDLNVGTVGTRGMVKVFISTATAPTTLDIPRPGDAGDYFGGRIALGDFNGDGYRDLAAIDGSYNIHIFYGTAGSISTTRGDKIAITGQINDLVGIDDFNGDGCDDIAVGQSTYNSNAGRVFVLFGDDKGAAGKTCVGDYTLQTGVSYIGNAGGTPGDRFGYTVRKAGNIKNEANDGKPFGSFVGGNYKSAAPAWTKIKVVYGQASPVDTTIAAYDATLNGLTQITTMFYGNFNGDAYSDFAVVESGKIKFFFGKTDGSGTDFPSSWTEGTNQITRSVIMDETVGAESGTWGIGASGSSLDVDGDGLTDFLVSGANGQYLYSGQGSFFSLHPSVYLPLTITNGSAQITILSYGTVVCNRNSGFGNCSLYYTAN